MVTKPRIARLLLAAALGLGWLPHGLASDTHTANAASAAPKIEWVLKPSKNSLDREALITITDRAGRPISNAKVTVSMDMPSMAGAHHVPPVLATPTSTPGLYTALLQPEMAGEWTARIEMSAPQRLKIFRKFNAD
jgi:uncharacterized GH25 family protein